MAARADDAGHSCSRIPSELCDGAVLDTGTGRREPKRTPRAFCDPCRSRIITCLEELPPAYERLGEALGEVPRTGSSAHKPFGPSEPVRAEIDALMRLIAAILPSWESRVRASRLQLAPRDPERDVNTPGSVSDAAKTAGTHIDVLLALEPAWMSRMFTFTPVPVPGLRAEQGHCRRCGHRIVRSARSGLWYLAEKEKAPGAVCGAWAHQPAPDPAKERLVIPEELESVIGDGGIVRIAGSQIVRTGDGWVRVMQHIGGAAAGNEILDMHYRARRHLGETRGAPESFDGVPCKACDKTALERADPPSDPERPANHSVCAECGDEMDRAEFTQWADMCASWAASAIRVCKRCKLAEPRHEECCWSACACTAGEHPRRRAAA